MSNKKSNQSKYILITKVRSNRIINHVNIISLSRNDAYIRRDDLLVERVLFRHDLIGFGEYELGAKVADLALNRPHRVLAELVELLHFGHVRLQEEVETDLVNRARRRLGG